MSPHWLGADSYPGRLLGQYFRHFPLAAAERGKVPLHELKSFGRGSFLRAAFGLASRAAPNVEAVPFS